MSKIISASFTKKQPIFQRLLNDICSICNFDKVFLMEIMTKIYICTDSNPVDKDQFQICTDLIDVYVDFSYIYSDQVDPEISQD